MKKTLALAAIALLAGSLASMAHATTTIRGTQQVVSYADLNLESEADAAILLSRIESAARNVCGLHQGPMPLAIQAHLEACAEAATARAVNDVNAPLLTHRQIVVSNLE